MVGAFSQEELVQGTWATISTELCGHSELKESSSEVGAPMRLRGAA